MRQRTKYVPPFELEKRMREQAKEIAERNVILAKSEIVLRMLADGMTTESIAKLTGVSVEEVEALQREN